MGSKCREYDFQTSKIIKIDVWLVYVPNSGLQDQFIYSAWPWKIVFKLDKEVYGIFTMDWLWHMILAWWLNINMCSNLGYNYVSCANSWVTLFEQLPFSFSYPIFFNVSARAQPSLFKNHLINFQILKVPNSGLQFFKQWQSYLLYYYIH